MIGELLLSSQTINEARIIINTAFSGHSDFNSIIVTNFIPPAFVTLIDDTILNWNYSIGHNAFVTIGGNRLLNITNLIDGASGVLIVKQDAGGNRTLTLPTGPGSVTNIVENKKGGGVILTKAGLSIDILHFFCRIVGAAKIIYWNYQNNYN